MKYRLLTFTGLGLVAVLVLALLPLSLAVAQGDPTPTVAPLSDFAIPTSTVAPDQPATPDDGDGGGLAIPTATQSEVGPTPGAGGLVIPTSTPGAPVVPALSLLTDDDLVALNLQPGDVPPDFAANQSFEVYAAAEIVASLRDGGYDDLADAWEAVVNAYGWEHTLGVSYTACLPTVPVNEIYSEISQLDSPAAARGFYADPDVGGVLQTVGYTLTPATTVNGWYASLPRGEGECFAQQTEYALTFEYWGLYIWISMIADANTDPALVTGLLDQLAPVIVARVDALAAEPFPPTPQPGAGEAFAAPTEALPPTEAALQPTPTVEPSNTPPPPPPTDVPGATVADVDAAMPTIGELGLQPPFAINQDLSGTYTLDQLVALAESAGLSGIAAATRAAGEQHGFIGQVKRVWDTGEECANTLALAVEVNIVLMASAEGAAAYAADPGIQGAWLATGLYSSFTPQPDGSILGTGATPNHPCGVVAFYNKIVPSGRFVIVVVITGSAQADQQSLLSSLDLLAEFVQTKLAQAGLE